MKNLLALAAFVLLLFVAVGYFRGWYNINTAPTDDGHKKVIIDINSQKVKQDLDTGTNKVKQILDKDGKPNEPASQNTSTPQPPAPITTTAKPTTIPLPPPLPPIHHSGDGSFVLPAPTAPAVPSTSKQPSIPEPNFDEWYFPPGK